MSSAATRIPIKIITLITFILSITLLVVCSWTLAGIYHRPETYEDWNSIEQTRRGEGQQPSAPPGRSLNGDRAAPTPATVGSAPRSPDDDALTWSNDRGRDGSGSGHNRNQNHEPDINSSDQFPVELRPTQNEETRQIEATTPETQVTEFFGRRRLNEKAKALDRYSETPSLAPTEPPRLLPTFIKMEGDYKWLATGCLAGSMLAGLIQCISSLFALCSYSKDIAYRMKLWIILQCIVFLILVITILVPLTYDPVKGQHLKLDEILPSTHSRMIYSIFNAGKSIHEILLHDFNAYFIVTIFNEALLLAFMISVCCLVKCGQQSYQPIRNNSRN